jgi:tRNA pseudouridine55 synthase
MTSPSRGIPVPSGILVIDKPAGMTSHDVVARVRKLAGTRRVGHAGTLDPMATGVLVIGVEKATRLLGHLALSVKEYKATIRLGVSTTTDDAEGEITATASAARVTDEALFAAVGQLTGEIQQIPPGVSAIKVNGRRAYKLAREGAAPELKPRPVTVYSFAITAVRREGDVLDADALVSCSSGTYIRALARDLGAALGTGGHLTALRRTQAGPYTVAEARSLDSLPERPAVIPLEQVAAASFPRRDLTDDEARRLAHGQPLYPLGGNDPPQPPPAHGGPAQPPVPPGPPAHGGLPVPRTPWPPWGSPIAAFAPDGTLVALLTEDSARARPLAVFTTPATI